MKIFVTIIQIILSISLIALIFLQPSSDLDGRSSNLFSTTANEKRGWEKIMYYLTITVLFLFLISSIIQTII
ncbi:MAG: preprotein translocase subunit SecG [Candidatus Shapirobacteria bacterium]|nr:preprotein translocase subunit SecG [Candidatus Shapirobacteria bacterium]